ncbi:metal ABC transporter permease [Limnochorda pilosa]|uniref:ABC transporter n=1 Tax=Limnochorda pilosa TaxID=1555112 RepID=A0A0K2SHE3_LIMPI|nr:metal ABC transporter permease [Limnochorda pilosa]BAS26541.1 ABC transporter [Limnochorda pilosa]
MDEIFAYEFMRRALLVVLLAGGLSSLVGFFVVAQRLAFAGHGVAHSAYGGLAIGLLLGTSPFWTGSLFAVAVALLIGWTTRKGRLPEDTTIGVFLAAAMALGTAVISQVPGYVDLFSLLFGNVLAARADEVAALAAVGGAVAFFVILRFHDLLSVAFSEELARIDGRPVAFLYYGLLVAVALVVMVSVRAVGVVLASALLVIPTAAARQLASGYRGVLGASLAVSLASGVGGLMLSFVWDIPSGASIVLLATLFFALSLAARPLRTL